MTSDRNDKSSPINSPNGQNKDNDDAERSEFLFIYDTRMANPNGDPDENRPRIDPYSGRNLVTEYRLKRTIRDYIKNHYGNNKNDKILIREDLNADGTRQKFEQLAKLDIDQTQGGRKGKNAIEVRKELVEEHIDVRLFGLMFLYAKKKRKSGNGDTESARGETPQFKKLGPVQFAIGQSLNKVQEMLIRNTRVVPTLERGARSGTFGEKSILKYSLIVFHGFLNQLTAKLNIDDYPLTENDVNKMMLAMWHGTNELNTSSKFGQVSRFLLRIIYSDPHGYIGDLDQKVILTNSNDENIANLSEADIDVGKLISTLTAHRKIIKKIQYACNDSMIVRSDEQKDSENDKIIENRKMQQKRSLREVLTEWSTSNEINIQCDDILCPPQTNQ